MSNEKEIFELMTKMYNDIVDIKREQISLRNEMNVRFDEVNTKLDVLTERVDDIEVKNALAHAKINREIKFLRHKVSDNESEIHAIKSHLNYC